MCRRDSNSGVRQEITLDYLIHRYPAATIGIVVLVFAAVTGVLGYILRTKSKNNKTIRDLLYRDRLTGAGNLNQFRMDAEKMCIRDRSRCVGSGFHRAPFRLLPGERVNIKKSKKY